MDSLPTHICVTLPQWVKRARYVQLCTITSPWCSFTRGAHDDVSYISSQIKSELLKISDWLTVNKLSLNFEKTKFMVSLSKREWENGSGFFYFRGLMINEFMNLSSHSAKIADKISRILGIMNGLERYLPFSAMELVYDSLILTHLQFGFTCWGFEWNMIYKLQIRSLRIMTSSKIQCPYWTII